jgi:hypothetical protein
VRSDTYGPVSFRFMKQDFRLLRSLFLLDCGFCPVTKFPSRTEKSVHFSLETKLAPLKRKVDSSKNGICSSNCTSLSSSSVNAITAFPFINGVSSILICYINKTGWPMTNGANHPAVLCKLLQHILKCFVFISSSCTDIALFSFCLQYIPLYIAFFS